MTDAVTQVEKIYERMAQERERRWRWWEQPVDDPPDRVTIRSILRDETAIIQLDGAGARKARKPQAPHARFWWDDTP